MGVGVLRDGELLLHVYDWDTPSMHGGCARGTISLTEIAENLERELS